MLFFSGWSNKNYQCHLHIYLYVHMCVFVKQNAFINVEILFLKSPKTTGGIKKHESCWILALKSNQSQTENFLCLGDFEGDPWMFVIFVSVKISLGIMVRVFSCITLVPLYSNYPSKRLWLNLFSCYQEINLKYMSYISHKTYSHCFSLNKSLHNFRLLKSEW